MPLVTRAPTSALGQKQTSALIRLVSAAQRKADIKCAEDQRNCVLWPLPYKLKDPMYGWSTFPIVRRTVMAKDSSPLQNFNVEAKQAIEQTVKQTEGAMDNYFNLLQQ